jgi:hypothetical protein
MIVRYLSPEKKVLYVNLIFVIKVAKLFDSKKFLSVTGKQYVPYLI